MTLEQFESVMASYAEGKSLNGTLREHGTGFWNMARYLKREGAPAEEVYSLARQCNAMCMVEQITATGVQAMRGKVPVDAARLHADNLKWLAVRMHPERLNPVARTDVTTGGEAITRYVVTIPRVERIEEAATDELLEDGG